MRTSILTKRDLDEMVRLFHTGALADEIGRRFRVTGRDVRYHLAARGLRYGRGMQPRTKLAAEMRRGRIYLLRGQGLTLPQMAADLHLHPNALRVWMGRHMAALYAQMKAESLARWKEGMRKRPRKPPKLRPKSFERQVRGLYGLGYSIAAIARRTGRHPMTIWRLLRCRTTAPRPGWRRRSRRESGTP